MRILTKPPRHRRTAQTLDLYVDNQQRRQALFNLTCTAQTSSGFHMLAAAAGTQVVGSASVNLQSGESHTFTVH